MPFEHIGETRSGFFQIFDAAETFTAYLHYSIFRNDTHSAYIQVYTDSSVKLGAEDDHDVHHFLDGEYHHSKLGFLSSQGFLKEGIELVRPGGEVEEYPAFTPLVVVLPDFSLDEKVKAALSDLPDNRDGALIRKLIGNYL